MARTLISLFSKSGIIASVLVRNEAALSRLQTEFPEHLFWLGDVTEPEQIDAWVEGTLHRYDRIDALINNAAITGPVGRLTDIDFEEFEQSVQINFLAPVLLCQKVIPHLERPESLGVLINLSGGGATNPRPRVNSYAAAKCALVRFTENLALEYPDLSIYAVSPGFMNTTMTQALSQIPEENLGSEREKMQTLLNQHGEESTQRAAETIYWLLTHRPRALTGKLISAVYDNYQTLTLKEQSPEWWTLRRVDGPLEKLLVSPESRG